MQLCPWILLAFMELHKFPSLSSRCGYPHTLLKWLDSIKLVALFVTREIAFVQEVKSKGASSAPSCRLFTIAAPSCKWGLLLGVFLYRKKIEIAWRVHLRGKCRYVDHIKLTYSDQLANKRSFLLPKPSERDTCEKFYLIFVRVLISNIMRNSVPENCTANRIIINV